MIAVSQSILESLAPIVRPAGALAAALSPPNSGAAAFLSLWPRACRGGPLMDRVAQLAA